MQELTRLILEGQGRNDLVLALEARERTEKQRNAEWHKERAIRFTASQIYKLLGKRGLNNNTFNTYLNSRISASFGVYESEAYSNSLDWGNEHEAEGISLVNDRFGYNFKQNGLVIHPEIDTLAGSSDGIDAEGVVLEIKCPYNPAMHVRHLLMRSADDLKDNTETFKYYAQIQCNMLIESAKSEKDFSGVFASYDPRYNGKPQGLKIIRLAPDFDLWDLIIQRVEEATNLLTAKLKQLWNNTLPRAKTSCKNFYD